MKTCKEEKLIRYFEDKKVITPREAIFGFDLFRLSDIIFRLRNKGYIIETERKGKANYAVYKLIKTNK